MKRKGKGKTYNESSLPLIFPLTWKKFPAGLLPPEVCLPCYSDESMYKGIYTEIEKETEAQYNIRWTHECRQGVDQICPLPSGFNSDQVVNYV
ncbi:hypothetical protein F2Q69_00036747 [Brassica cretica]|uniref:Uncharacterized protein n=1 Tax=Brassica cretica TaxID=69181 RepID=A0A8S9SH51_BRACR|nr:hypothetical protein F2Q69_00036747 [Brassica cretica]